MTEEIILKKILLIENQWVEFKQIAKVLVDRTSETDNSKYIYKVLLINTNDQNDQNDQDMDLFYKEEDQDVEKQYTLFADNIRIWVNTEYNLTDNKSYREKAFNTLRTMAIKADLIIMDYILGGSYRCKKGTDLAKELVESIPIDKMKPVLFLSKTEHIEKNRLDEYEKYVTFIKDKYRASQEKITEEELKRKVNEHTMWVHKGYFGDEILNPDFIRKYLIKGGIEELLQKNEEKSESNSKKPYC
jgi:hypothetical protein